MSVWPIVLALAAGYNFVLGGAGLTRKGASLDARLTALLVLCFGLVYALVATDIARFVPVLWTGVVGKLGVIAIVLPAVLRGEAPKGTAIAIAGDAVFTVLFLALLLGPNAMNAAY